MFAEHRFVALEEADRSLHLRANRKDWAIGPDRHLNRRRHVTASPAHRHRGAAVSVYDRIIDAALDAAVVQKVCVGNLPETPERLFVVGDQRLVARIARGHDQRPDRLGQQQVVQRRVRKHQADPRTELADGRREHRPVGFRQQDDGPSRTEQ